MKFKYIWLFTLLIGFLSCEENESPIPEEVVLPELTSGNADFTNYVSIGASFTAGFSDGALFKASQENSFPSILSKEFMKIGGGTFTQPLLDENTGGILAGGTPTPFGYRLVFGGAGPVPLNLFLASQGAPVPSITTEAGNNVGSDFKNFGIPGAKSFHLVTPGYAAFNPYYTRIASSGTSTLLEDALAQSPTFFTLGIVGGNDILQYATSGGTGVDQTGNIDPSTYAINDITDPNVFTQAFSTTVTALTQNGAKGVVMNVPYVKDLPFFTTVPNNALVLDAETAAQLTGIFQAVSGIFLQGALFQGVPLEQAQALAAQYAITFSAGPNRWIIDAPVTQTNPLGFRQMTEDELLVLTIDQSALANGYGTVLITPEVLQVLGLLQQGGTPTPQQAGLVIAAVNGIDDGDVLDSDELAEIKTATDAYNTTIASVASSNENVALVDLNAILTELASTGINFDGFNLSANLVTGGAVSLDGIHLTARGYAFMANKILEAIDAKFGSNFISSGNIPKANDYPTNYSPLLQ